MKPSIQQQQNKGIQWNTITSVLVFFIQFTVSYFLNKLIDDNEFGVALWAYALVSFSIFFSTFSWFDILIRQKKVNEVEYSTAFYISIITNGLLFVIFFFGAEKIASFSTEFNSTTHLKLYSFLFIINALAMVPTAKLTKAIAFKTLSKINVAAKIISSAIAITLALMNKPFTSLFFLYLGTEILSNIFIIFCVRWLPQFKFSVNHFKAHFGFAATLTFQKFASNIGNSLDTILIGKDYMDNEVASYSKSYGIRSMPISFIARSITKVTYPVLSELNENEEEFETVFFNTQQLIAFILFPIFGLIFALAKPFAIAYFSTDWDIPLITRLLQLFALSGLFASFNSLFYNALNLRASSSKINQITVIQRVVFIVLLIATLKISLLAIALAKVISSIFDFIVFGIYTNMHIRQNYFYSLKQLAIPFMNIVVAGLLSYAMYYFVFQDTKALIAFLVCSVVFGLAYLLLGFLFDKKGFREFKANFLNK